MSANNLDKIFKPKSIAIIGVSNSVGSAGYRIFRNIIGSVHPLYGIRQRNFSVSLVVLTN
jgi:hypothetical protein